MENYASAQLGPASFALLDLRKLPFARGSRQPSKRGPQMSPIAEKISEITALSAVGPVPIATSKYDRLSPRAKQVPPFMAVVAHPCDETSLRRPVEPPETGIIIPIFVGPKEKI